MDIQKLTVLLTFKGLHACLLRPQDGGACMRSAVLTGMCGMKAGYFPSFNQKVRASS